MDSNIDTSERTRRQNLASNARKLISQVLQAEDVAGSPLQLQHFGSHAVNVEAGRYSYRSIHWLDTELAATDSWKYWSAAPKRPGALSHSFHKEWREPRCSKWRASFSS